MEGKKTKIIIISIVVLLILVAVTIFMITKDKEKPSNTVEQNTTNTETNEEIEPPAGEEPIQGLNNATFTPVIE